MLYTKTPVKASASCSFIMMVVLPALLASLAILGNASPVAQPAITPAPKAPAAKRATSCTFSGSNGYASASASQTACSTIVLANVAVPSGVTLDLSKLPDDTSVSDPYMLRFCSISLSRQNMVKSRSISLTRVNTGHLPGNNDLGLQRMGRAPPPNPRHRNQGLRCLRRPPQPRWSPLVGWRRRQQRKDQAEVLRCSQSDQLVHHELAHPKHACPGGQYQRRERSDHHGHDH